MPKGIVLLPGACSIDVLKGGGVKFFAVLFCDREAAGAHGKVAVLKAAMQPAGMVMQKPVPGRTVLVRVGAPKIIWK